MNLVIDEAAEVFVKDAKPRRELGASLNIFCPRSTYRIPGRTNSPERRQYYIDSADTMKCYIFHNYHSRFRLHLVHEEGAISKQ